MKRVHQTAAGGGGGGRFANYFCARVADASRGLKAKRISIAQNLLCFFLSFYANTSHRCRLTCRKPQKSKNTEKTLFDQLVGVIAFIVCSTQCTGKEVRCAVVEARFEGLPVNSVFGIRPLRTNAMVLVRHLKTNTFVQLYEIRNPS